MYDRTKPSQTASALGVLIVDDDEILREMLVEVLRIEGIQKCISADTLGSVQEQQKEALACGLAILDINLGPGEPTGIEVHNWLRSQGFRGQIIFLTGHAADDPRVLDASRIKSTTLLQKPISIETLAHYLRAA